MGGREGGGEGWRGEGGGGEGGRGGGGEGGGGDLLMECGRLMMEGKREGRMEGLRVGIS